jgi:hypothetical protein
VNCGRLDLNVRDSVVTKRGGEVTSGQIRTADVLE